MGSILYPRRGYDQGALSRIYGCVIAKVLHSGVIGFCHCSIR